MSTKVFNLPDLGEGLTESEISSWRVAEGDVVEVNQVLADVETAKAVVELSSPYAGTIRSLHAAEGETVDVGAPVITFDLGGTDDDGSDEEDGGRVPTLVGYGSAPDKGRPARRARRGTSGPTSAAAATAQTEPPAADAAQALRPADEAGRSGERPRSTPPVRLFAKQNGVDLEQVSGSGAGGVITRADVEAVLADGTATPAQGPRAAGSDSTGQSTATRTLGGRPRTETVPVKGVRKATAQAMVSSAFTAPHVTEFLQVDVTETMELLAELKASRDYRDVKLTPMTLAAKACLVAMERTRT